MSNMGQIPQDQCAPPWGQIQVFENSDKLGISYTVLESYFDEMYSKRHGGIGEKHNINSNLTSKTSKGYNKTGKAASHEKPGFEESILLTPLANDKTSSSDKSLGLLHKDIWKVKLTASECNDVTLGNVDSDYTIKEESILHQGGAQPEIEWGNRPASMHFEALKIVSEHLVERIKLEDSLFRDALQSGTGFPMCAAPTSTTATFGNPWALAPQCNLNNFSSYVNEAASQAQAASSEGNIKTSNKAFSVGSKEHAASLIQTANINRSMTNNLMCTTMFLMNDSLQQNSAHQSHGSNTKKHQDIFNVGCEKGCNCEAASSIFRAGSSQMFSADKHAAAKHFMSSCGPLQLTAQECSEYLLKKVTASNSLVGSDGTHLGIQNASGTAGSSIHKSRESQDSQANLDSSQQASSASSGEKQLSTTATNTPKYRVPKERPFSCPECGKSFLLKHHLVTHARVHTGERPHICPECGKSFAHKHCLSTHLLLHSSQRPYQCLECKKSFTLKHHLVTHARVHSRDRPFVCRECGRTFPQKRHLATHAKFHSGERPHVCEQCGETFSREEHLVIHSRFHGGLHPYVCPDCGSTFARKFELVNHGRLHGRIPHSCDICGKEFLQKRTLLAHARLHAEGERPFVCPTCGETFQRKTELVEHSHIHADVDKSFICRECGDCFQNREALALHYRLHAGDRNFVADLCGLAAAFQQPATHFLCPTPLHPPGAGTNLSKIPMGSAPSGMLHITAPPQPKPKPYVCPDCGKCFTQKHGLAQHNRRHSGGSCDIRQHACDKCGKAFYQKNHLILHQRQHLDPNQSNNTPVSQEKTYNVNVSQEKTYNVNVSQEKTYNVNVSQEKTYEVNVSPEKSYDVKPYDINVTQEKSFDVNIPVSGQ